jgi:hypothetical protein
VDIEIYKEQAYERARSDLMNVIQTIRSICRRENEQLEKRLQIFKEERARILRLAALGGIDLSPQAAEAVDMWWDPSAAYKELLALADQET